MQIRRSVLIVIAVALSALAAAPCGAQDPWQQEGDRLARLLKWQPGSVVADIGAGKGNLTVEAARRVGPSGKVYTTELDVQELDHLKELESQRQNIVAVKAAETDTNLPPACCDSIFMRLVYHHFTRPVEMDASLFRSLKPGGLLAVVDETPQKGSILPEGVPKNRGGHGIPQAILIQELTAAGFKLLTIDNKWPGDEYHAMYCVVFRKSKP